MSRRPGPPPCWPPWLLLLWPLLLEVLEVLDELDEDELLSELESSASEVSTRRTARELDA